MFMKILVCQQAHELKFCLNAVTGVQAGLFGPKIGELVKNAKAAGILSELQVLNSADFAVHRSKLELEGALKKAL